MIKAERKLMVDSDIEKEIKKVFECTVYPGDGNIATDAKYLSFESLKDFIGKKWQEITLSFLVPKHVDSLGFMTPFAFAYYLPAYMLATIQHYDRADLIPDNLVAAFTVPSSEDMNELLDALKGIVDEAPPSLVTYDIDEATKRFYEIVSLFSDEQKQVIYDFLVYLAEQHGDDFCSDEPQRAISRYWNRYANG